MDVRKARRVVGDDDVALDRIRDALDAQSPDDEASELRRTQRLAYRAGIIIVSLSVHDGNLEPPFVAPTRNICGGGLAFFHARLLHRNTKCRIRIQAHSGVWHELDAVIVHGREISSSLYELGVRFNHPLNTALYLAEHAENVPVTQSTDSHA